MSNTSRLTDLERDALAEIFNISLGAAANLLSEMISDEILLSVPSLKLITTQQLQEVEDLASQDICAIEQKFEGGLGKGAALLLFKKKSSLQIVQMMIKDYISIEEVSQFEKDALSEIGNIILNSILSTLADLAAMRIETQIPEFFVGDYQTIFEENFNQEVPSGTVLLVVIDYKIKGVDIKGYIFFLMEVSSLKELSQVLINKLK